ncbi:hypothetical protein ACKWRH_27715 [Bradyrhizobium sp. Pa8]|uniref:hypothetical protein n=1 Tax=Bradyrhizobium sp. Pa8 TaxID=3386552 RepID=UPI00403EFFD4
MRPRTASDDNLIDFNAMLHPGTVFDHPRDVLAAPSLSTSEKRAILASWASDASAIASSPSLRAPTGLKAPVTIDDICVVLLRPTIQLRNFTQLRHYVLAWPLNSTQNCH